MAAADLTTIARPYARAVFELARDRESPEQKKDQRKKNQQKNFEHWSEMLGFMATVAHNGEMRALLDSPRLSDEQAAEMFIAVCRDRIDDEAQNFVKLLVENGRLILLAEIAALYEHYRAEAEGTIEARVVSAKKLGDSQQTAIAEALQKRLGREVKLTCRVDESLLGGAIIHAGDLVIDGSVRGRLNNLATALAR